MFWKRKKKKPEAPEPQKSTPDAIAAMGDVAEGWSIDIDAARLKYIEENAIQRTAPQIKNSEGMAMDSACSTAIAPAGDFSNISARTLSYYVASSSFIGYAAMSVIGQHWLMRKGLSMKPRDAAKKWYDLAAHEDSGIDDTVLKKITRNDKKMHLKAAVIEALTFNNMFGIRHVLFRNKNPDFDYSQPFNPDSFKNGQYAGIAQIDPQWVTPEFNNDDLTDPAGLGFYEPEYWVIQGRRYHKSHFVILTGDDVPDYLKPTYRYGGISVTQKAYERIYAAERTANEAPQLTLTKRKNVRKTDLAEAQANKAQFMKNLQMSVDLANNYGYEVVDTAEEIQQLDTALGDLDAVIKGQFHLVASILGVPVSKLLGTGHAGLGTGETDEDYYISDLEELQENDMQEICEAHYQRLLPSMGIDGNIDIVWKPMKVMSEKERAETQEIKARTARQYWDMGSIDEVDVRERISADEDSGFNGLPEREVVGDGPDDQETEI